MMLLPGVYLYSTAHPQGGLQPPRDLNADSLEFVWIELTTAAELQNLANWMWARTMVYSLQLIAQNQVRAERWRKAGAVVYPWLS